MAKKTAAFIVAGAMLLNTAFPVLAETTISISDNESESESTADVSLSTDTTLSQSNSATISNNIQITNETGGNTIEDIDGGDATIDSGSATTDVAVTNMVNANIAEVGAGGSDETNVLIEDNGSKSENTAEVDIENNTVIGQTNNAAITNYVTASNYTGDNSIKDVTDGSAEISTGNATNEVALLTLANLNMAQVGGNDDGDSFSAEIKGNGSRSENSIGATLAQDTTLDQINYADILNDIWVTNETGENSVRDVSDGDAGIFTGNAKAEVGVDNVANFNFADIGTLGSLLSVSGEISDNGSKSENDIELDWAANKSANQENSWECLDNRYPQIGDFVDGIWEQSQGCNNVSVFSDTGNNTVKDITDGEAVVDTGNSEVEGTVENTGNLNVLGSLPESILEDLLNLDFTFDLGDLLNSLGLA
jgi:hypothetical protein